MPSEKRPSKQPKRPSKQQGDEAPKRGAKRSAPTTGGAGSRPARKGSAAPMANRRGKASGAAPEKLNRPGASKPKTWGDADAKPKRGGKPGKEEFSAGAKNFAKFIKPKTPKVVEEEFEPAPRKRAPRTEKPTAAPTPEAKGKTEDTGTRLNKYLSNSGIAARRKADELIAAGHVQVNGAVVREMGYKVQQGDKVTFQGKDIRPNRNLVYVLLNKPKDFITTSDDEKGRRTVMELIANATDERVYPVGRLDRQTTGLLLFTNDGELAQKLTHPKFGVRKIYSVTLDKALHPQDKTAIKKGVTLEDGVALVDDIAYTNDDDKREVGIEIHIGKNRIVRRIFEHLGYEVVKLDRVMYAGLTKKDLPRGRWRHLEQQEIIMLRHFKG